MPERARALFDRAKQVQPGFYWMGYYASQAFLVEDRPREARAEIQRTLAAAREDPNVLLLAGHILATLGDFAAARDYFERGLSASTWSWWKEELELIFAWILQQSGETERAQRVLEDASSRFETRRRGHPRRPEDYVESARIRLMAGDREAALRLMEEAVRQGWRIYNESPNTNDPILKSLRGDPRYDRLMAEAEADVARQRARVEREGW